MESVDGVVYIHGYKTDGFEGNVRKNETVWESRIEQALDVCDLFQSLGVSVELVFLGGFYESEKDGEWYSNEIRMYQFAKEQYSEDIESLQVSCVAEHDVNTEDEIEMAKTHSNHVDASFIVSVSSSDHTPRIARLWAAAERGDEPIIFVSSADDDYSQLTTIQDDENPFILEGAMFEPLIDALNTTIWDIDYELYDEAASDIQDVLQEYEERSTRNNRQE